MTTLKKTITLELLDSISDPAGLQDVFDRRKSSKGPFYLGLADATDQLQRQLDQVCAEVTQAESRRSDLQIHIAALEVEAEKLQEVVERASHAEGQLADSQELLERVEWLSQRGFGQEELNRLYEIVGKIAADNGLSPEEGIAQFFKTVGRYEQIVSLELEIRKVESRCKLAQVTAEQSQAEAKSREAHSNARIATIDLVEGLLESGVREGDFAQWTRLLEKAEVPIEALTSELDRFGSLELLCNDRMQNAEKLQEQVAQAKAGLKALQHEQGKVKAAIVATRNGALREMERTGSTARQHLDDLLAKLKEYGELQREAEKLKEELALTRAFMSQDQSEWSKVPVWVVQRLVLGLIHWTAIGEHNTMISPPEQVSFRYPWLMPSCVVTMIDLLLWVLVGMHNEKEKQPFVRLLSSR